MRVLVVGNGQSVHVVGRSQALAARGANIRLVTLGPVLPSVGIETCTRPIPRNPVAAAHALHGFLRDVRSFRPDLLHLHYAGGRLGSLALLSGIRPLAVNVMGGDVLPAQHPGGLSRAARRTTRRILERADLLLVKSQQLLSAMAEFADAAQKAHVVRWGVDPERFYPDPQAATECRRRLHLDNDALLVLSPRLVRPLYNIHLIVDAFAELAPSVPTSILLITEYGSDAEYRRQIEARIADRGLAARVRFIGTVPHAAMRELYSAAAAVVMVPASDGLPQSLFESLACGAPVVVGRLPAYAEIVEEGISALYADFKAESIAAALGRLLRDERLRSALADAGRARVAERASLPSDIERVARLFEGLVGRPRPKPRPDPLGTLLDLLSLATS